MQVIESILQSYIPVHLHATPSLRLKALARLDVLTHQPLNTQESPIPNFGILMPNQLDQPRFTL